MKAARNAETMSTAREWRKGANSHRITQMEFPGTTGGGHNETSCTGPDRNRAQRMEAPTRETERNDADRRAPTPVIRFLSHGTGVRIPVPVPTFQSSICQLLVRIFAAASELSAKLCSVGT